tara:strand:- start:1671 stop:4088 length:2418 start_codon:yes stop_codon:yes gene_type:complete
MIYTNTQSSFPDQVVPQEEKMTLDYGLQVGRAIEGEWWSSGVGGARYTNNYNVFHRRRLYARAEQSIEKYKDEMAIDGDLSYLNLDWTPVAIIPKFVDIVVNGMSEKIYDIKAYAQDPASQQKRTAYAEKLHKNIVTRDFINEVKAQMGVDISEVKNMSNPPQNEEELEIHLQLDYKQSVEIAEEEVINNVLDRNKYELTKRRLYKDLVELGIGCVKTTWNKSEGVVVDYVDPVDVVYSYTDDPNFEDLYYVGEVKNISLPELKKQFPNLTDDELSTIQKMPGNTNYRRNYRGNSDSDTIQVLYFEYKTYTDQVFKIKKTANGLEKALEKPDTFAPPPNDGFERVSRSIEVLYHGAKILGHPIMLDWKVAENMTRPKSNLCKVNMNYTLCAPSMYKGRITSLVERMITFGDMIQLTSLKLQQVLARMVPDGVYLDVDGLAEVDLGNGTSYNPREALNMYFQTGSIVGRSMTQDGDMNPGRVPIQELQTSAHQAKITSLIQTYQYYLQMIRDVTGLNEARDGSNPDKDALLGLQKLAVAQSNVATRHILDAGLYVTLKTCENIALRVADSLEFELTNEALVNSISLYNVATLEEIKELHLYDFGIYLDLEPDEEDKHILEQNIEIALKGNQINLEDAIDIRNIHNLRLANQLLKLKRRQKAKQDQEAQQRMIQTQAQANAESAEKAAMFEVQKREAISQTELQLEKGKSDFRIQQMAADLQNQLTLAQQRFEFDKQLAILSLQKDVNKEQMIEDRKDQRSKMEATQQSSMIQQRQDGLLPTDFATQNQGQPLAEELTNQTPPMEQP